MGLSYSLGGQIPAGRSRGLFAWFVLCPRSMNFCPRARERTARDSREKGQASVTDSAKKSSPCCRVGVTQSGRGKAQEAGARC